MRVGLWQRRSAFRARPSTHLHMHAGSFGPALVDENDPGPALYIRFPLAPDFSEQLSGVQQLGIHTG